MSLVLLAHACSHLQNASLARLGLTSLPQTNQLHSILLQLQKHGYVNTVAIAGPVPPPPSALAPIMSLHSRGAGLDETNHVAGPFDARIRNVDGLPEEAVGNDHDSSSSSEGRASDESIVTQSNVSSRRLWVGLKYYNNRPVLEKMSLVSKPTRRVWMGVRDFEGLVMGDRRGYVKGLRGIGEAMFASTDKGVMEVRECVERRLGGMLLCRINGV